MKTGNDMAFDLQQLYIQIAQAVEEEAKQVIALASQPGIYLPEPNGESSVDPVNEEEGEPDAEAS